MKQYTNRANSSSESCADYNESLILNEPIQYARGNSWINLNTRLLSASYSIWRTEPTRNFNSVSFFWNYKANGITCSFG